MKVLVVGARPDSLGAAIAEAVHSRGWEAVTAGIPGPDRLMAGGERLYEDHHLDLIGKSGLLTMLLDKVHPNHIVVTTGINRPQMEYGHNEDCGVAAWYLEHFNVNVVGPMRLCEAWLWRGTAGHFVAISSNSAHIARSWSSAYCSSKAALSMALRVRAREVVGDGRRVIYGYEPGLLAGTPMTRATEARLRGVPLTRMPGLPLGLNTHWLASLIVYNLATGGMELNGTCLRIDAGEQ